MADRPLGSPGLHVHRSERTDELLSGLARVLRTTPADPLAADLVAVPTPGIERFIAQGLGAHLGVSAGGVDGVCANVVFPAPVAVVNQVIADATGLNPSEEPWLAHRAVWPLLAVIDRDADESWCHPVAHHLGRAARSGDAAGLGVERVNRRFAVASRVAGLFASYASQRPEMLLEWAAGRATDGAGAALPDALMWQFELWRQLRTEIGTPSPAERLADACAMVRSDPSVVDLPERISVFGPTRLPADHLQVLVALGAAREVHLWLADASPAQWQATVAGDQDGRAAPRRRLDASADATRHPLVRSMGRDARELRLRLTSSGDAQTPRIDEHLPAPLGDQTLLDRLHRQLRDDIDPWTHRAEAGPLRLAPDDRSVQVHACHGQARQAEVVREVVLGMLQSDPMLEPRDILIMCPDLDTFAPLLSAAFSDPADAGGASGGHRGAQPGSPMGPLRLRIADRTPEQSNEVLAALAVLLEMVDGRMELSTVLDFVSSPPVRTRFSLDDDALERIAELATQAGIRWGLDDTTRGQYQLTVPAGTWAWGLDRLLLGAALSEDGLPILGDVLPVDDVQSGDVALVGSLAELVTRLAQIRDAMAGTHPLGRWVDVLSAAVTDLMDARRSDSWQVPNALAAITALAAHADGYAGGVDLRLADVRWMLAGILAGRPTRSNFRTGGLTVCGLVPMRSVPHRVICLVGMDDGAFPRSVVPDGDDILARDPLVGERDPRSEDRQLLLDTLMAATEHLVITYTGADDRTNERRPPCVPLGELLDTLDAMAITADGAPARAQVRITHPLQPFDARNFTAGALGAPGPFSHDLLGLAAARTVAGPRHPAGPFLAGDLPAVPTMELSLKDLGAFLASPPGAFLRTRIGVPLRPGDDPPPERLPLEVAGLDEWMIGTRVLTQLVHDIPGDRVRDAELHRGDLPPGALGVEAIDSLGADVAALARGTVQARDGLPPRQVVVRLDLPGGVRLTGSVPAVHGKRIVRATYSRSKAAHQLRVWPEMLAAAAAEPSPGWGAHLIARGGGEALTAPDADRCIELLADLVALYAAGLCSPLPLLPAAGKAYADKRVAGRPVPAAVSSAWFAAGGRTAFPEWKVPEVRILWGPTADLHSLLTEPPRPDERWYPDEPSRFGALARRVWEPILAAGRPL